MVKKRCLSLDGYQTVRPPPRELRNVATDTTPKVTLTDLPVEIFKLIVGYVDSLVQIGQPVDFAAKHKRERVKQFNMLRFVNQWTLKVLQRSFDQTIEATGDSVLKMYRNSFYDLQATEPSMLIVWAAVSHLHCARRLIYKGSTRKAAEIMEHLSSNFLWHTDANLRSDNEEAGRSTLHLDILRSYSNRKHLQMLLTQTFGQHSAKADVEVLCIGADSTSWDGVITSLNVDLEPSPWMFTALRRLDIVLEVTEDPILGSILVDLVKCFKSSLQTLNISITLATYCAWDNLTSDEHGSAVRLLRLESLAMDVVYEHGGATTRPLSFINLRHVILTRQGVTCWQDVMTPTLQTFSLLYRSDYGDECFDFRQCNWSALAGCRNLCNVVLQLREEEQGTQSAISTSIGCALQAMMDDCTARIEQLVILDCPYVTPGEIFDLLCTRRIEGKQLRRIGLLNCRKTEEVRMQTIQDAFPETQILCAHDETSLANPIKAMIRCFPTFDFDHLVNCQVDGDRIWFT